MRHLMRAAMFAVATVIACSDTTAPTPQPQPRPGALEIVLTTPHANDGAILLRVTGPTPVTQVAAARSDHVLHQLAVDGVLRVAVFGPLASGALATFNVPDVARAGEYAATVVEVSDDANALREDRSGYRLVVRARP